VQQGEGRASVAGAGAATAWLLDRYHPAAPRRSTFPGRTVPIDLRPAEGLLGFAAEHTYLPD
jgi:hypothetical protein